MSRIKYPRTYHVPWSPGATSDDKRHGEVASLFEGGEVAVTEKIDGENSTLYADGGSHARSLDSANHPSRNWVKAMVAPLLIGNLPDGWRVCGENAYARHSIGYEKLPSYFLVFSIWNEKNVCLSWKETKEWCALLGLTPVPTLYEGPWDEKAIRECYRPDSAFGGLSEGYVVRKAGEFAYGDFKNSVAKYVRSNHVQTESHWMHDEIVPNGLGS